MNFLFLFLTSDWCVEQASFFNSSYKSYHVKKKKKIWESLSKGQLLCIFRGFVNEPGHPKKNRTGRSEGSDTHVVQQYRRLETTHTFHRNCSQKKQNKTRTAQLVCCRWTDWQTRPRLFLVKGVGLEHPESDVPPPVPADGIAAERQGGDSRRLGCPTYKHVGKAFKTELPQ